MRFRNWREWLRSDCAADPRRLSAFLDDELDPNQSAKLRQHVGECVRCRSTVSRLRFVKDSLTKLHIPDFETENFHPLYLYTSQRESQLPIYKKLWDLRISVPIPILALALLLVAVILLTPALKSVNKPELATTIPQPVVVNRTIEVPVERVRTRIVYIDRHRSTTTANPKFIPAAKASLASSLESFRPTNDINLRLVKEPEQ